MGSKGSKPRKPSHSEHLPKVGTPRENEIAQKSARRAVEENMSFGGRSESSKANTVLGAIGILAILGAIGGLLLLVLR